MKKPVVGHVVVLFLLLFALLLSSCDSSGSNTQAQRSQKDYHTGTEGLVISFVENNPPSRIYAGDIYSSQAAASLLLEVKNKGAFPETSSGKNLPHLYVTLGGYDPDIFRVRDDHFENNRLDGDLQGKSEFNPNGGYATLYTEASINLPGSVDTYNPIVLATLCYDYETDASPQICIDPDPFSATSKKKVCTVHDISMSGGQGGPVSVSKIEHDTTADEDLLKIYVKNVGGGVIVNKQSGGWTTCMTPKQMDLDIVQYEVKLYNHAGDCDPDFNNRANTMKLINGEGIIFCRFPKLDSKGTDAYVTPLAINLAYRYKITTQKQLEILSTN